MKSSGVQSLSRSFRKVLRSSSATSGGIFEIRNVLRLIGRLIGGGGAREVSSTTRIAQERSAIMLSRSRLELITNVIGRMARSDADTPDQK